MSLLSNFLKNTPKLLFDKIEKGNYANEKGKLVDAVAYKTLKNLVFAATSNNMADVKLIIVNYLKSDKENS